MAADENIRQVLGKGIWQATTLVIIGIIFGLAVNALRLDGLPLFTRAGSSQTGIKPIEKISLPDVFQLYTHKKAVFVDTRDPYDFAQGHIPRALNIQPGTTGAMIDALRSSQGKPIITYCSGPDCPLAEKLAQELKTLGISDVKVMTEGWYAWQNSGYPVEGNP